MKASVFGMAHYHKFDYHSVVMQKEEGNCDKELYAVNKISKLLY